MNKVPSVKIEEGKSEIIPSNEAGGIFFMFKVLLLHKCNILKVGCHHHSGPL